MIKMSGNKHAEAMKQYAEDAAIHEFPYMLWQYNITGEWHDLMKHPEWDYNTKYRRKPIEQDELIGISALFMKPLKLSDVNFDSNQIIYPIFYAGKGEFGFDERPMNELNNSFVSHIVFHTTKENAQKHVDVLNQVYLGELK